MAVASTLALSIDIDIRSTFVYLLALSWIPNLVETVTDPLDTLYTRLLILRGIFVCEHLRRKIGPVVSLVEIQKTQVRENHRDSGLESHRVRWYCGTI